MFAESNVKKQRSEVAVIGGVSELVRVKVKGRVSQFCALPRKGIRLNLFRTCTIHTNS
jgi:hypothetical protein